MLLLRSGWANNRRRGGADDTYAGIRLSLPASRPHARTRATTKFQELSTERVCWAAGRCREWCRRWLWESPTLRETQPKLTWSLEVVCCRELSLMSIGIPIHRFPLANPVRIRNTLRLDEALSLGWQGDDGLQKPHPDSITHDA